MNIEYKKSAAVDKSHANNQSCRLCIYEPKPNSIQAQLVVDNIVAVPNTLGAVVIVIDTESAVWVLFSVHVFVIMWATRTPVHTYPRSQPRSSSCMCILALEWAPKPIKLDPGTLLCCDLGIRAALHVLCCYTSQQATDKVV